MLSHNTLHINKPVITSNNAANNYQTSHVRSEANYALEYLHVSVVNRTCRARFSSVKTIQPNRTHNIVDPSLVQYFARHT